MPRGPELPRAFQSPRALRALNVASVAFGLASVTGAVFAHAFGNPEATRAIGLSVGLPTLACGLAWAGVLRLRKTIGRSNFRWGWLASVPLAILNAGAASALFFSQGVPPGDGLVFGFIMGTTFGAIFWLPALVATLLCFGLPIGRAHVLASRGIAGEERGERFVGVVAAILSLAGLAGTLGLPSATASQHPTQELAGFLVLLALGLGGAASGGAAAVLAHLRGLRRRAFVGEVEAGKVAGYRVESVAEGRALVRVTSVGQGYRVVDFEEIVHRERDEAVQAPLEQRADTKR